MTFAVLTAVALSALIVALLLLRSLGIRFRIGRLLSAAPQATIAEARRLATEEPRYVRVNGRISSDEEFPDENDRPLVFRRKRLQLSDRRGWRTIADEVEAVPFGVETRDEFIAVDAEAMRDGLIAIPREAAGTLADLPADLIAGVDDLPPSTAPARLLIEQLSAVEHATVCGTPVLRDGQPTMTAGLGRPLIVTSLDQPAAMRLLASGERPRVLAAAALLTVALAAATGAVVGLIAGI
jgi:hypothetical protein